MLSHNSIKDNTVQPSLHSVLQAIQGLTKEINFRKSERKRTYKIRKKFTEVENQKVTEKIRSTVLGPKSGSQRLSGSVDREHGGQGRESFMSLSMEILQN